jgi:hypothetical protein
VRGLRLIVTNISIQCGYEHQVVDHHGLEGVQLEMLLASSKRDRGVIAGRPGRRMVVCALRRSGRKNDPVQRRTIEPTVNAVLQMQRRPVIRTKDIVQV